MKKKALSYMVYVFVAVFLGGCKEDDLVIHTDSWGVPMEAFSLDSCFSPQRVPRGFLVIPPTEGKEFHRMAFDPLDDNALYLTTLKRPSRSEVDEELYRLDLVENSLTFVTTLVGLNGGKLMLNRKAELLSCAMGEGVTIFELSSLELLAEDIFGRIPFQRVWASDSTFWTSFSIFENGQPIPYWGLHAFDGTMIDTFAYPQGRVSRGRNGKTIFHTHQRPQLDYTLFVHDQSQHSLVDSMKKIDDPRLQFLAATPLWLDDHRVLLHFEKLLMVADLAEDSYLVIRDFPENCKNYTISSVCVHPHRPNELLYVLNQYFYNEQGEYRKRHDIVHLNTETGEENVLLIDL